MGNVVLIPTIAAARASKLIIENMKKFLHAAAIVCSLAVVLAPYITAQGAPQAQAARQTPAFDLQQTIPFDSAVRTGTLPNGLRYFLRHNDRPADRVTL